MKKHYLVVSPTYDIPLYIDGQVFPYYEPGADVVAIECNNKKDALSLALCTPEMSKWVNMCRENMTNPFNGLKVEESICEHGFCWCGCLEYDYCLDCIS